jgi:hypothetical protein
MMRARTLLVIPALLMVAQRIRAQESSAPAPQDAAKAAVTQMKSDLRNLITAQEAYFADHAAYAGAVGDLRFRASENVSVRLTATQNNAWAGEARSALLPNVACVVWINLAEKNRPKVGGKLLEQREGEPACAEIQPAK